MATTSATVRVLAFARYADLLGADSLEVPVPTPPTVAGLVASVRRLPGGSGLPPVVLVAVNAHQAGPDDPITPGDEVALLPPMAGG